MEEEISIPSDSEGFASIILIPISFFVVKWFWTYFSRWQGEKSFSLSNGECFTLFSKGCITSEELRIPSISGDYSISVFFDDKRDYTSSPKIQTEWEDGKMVFIPIHKKGSYFSLPRFKPEELGLRGVSVCFQKEGSPLLLFNFSKEELVCLSSIKRVYLAAIAKIEESAVLAQAFDED